MNLTTFLEALPQSEIEIMAQVYSLGNLNSKKSYIRYLVKILTDETRIREQVKNLNLKERFLLKYIFFTRPVRAEINSFFRHDRTAQEQIDSHIESLKQKGLIFKATSGSQHFEIPEEMEIIFYNLFQAEVARNLKDFDPSQFQVVYGINEFECDLIRTINFLEHNKARITHSGKIYKKEEASLSSLLHSNTSLDILLPFCIEYGFMYERKGVLEVSRDIFERWLSQEYYSRVQAALNYLIHHFSSKSILRSFYIALQVFRCLPPDRWFETRSLRGEIEHYATQEQLPDLNFIFQFFSDLGLLNLAMIRDQVLGFMVTPIAARIARHLDISDLVAKKFVLQASGEIIAQRNIDSKVRFILECLAEFVKDDYVLHYQLTSNSIHKALELSLNLDDIKKFLLEHSEGEVPQNINYQLEQWAGKYDQLAIYDNTVFYIDAPNLVIQFEKDEQIDKYIFQKLTPQVYVIKRGRAYHFRNYLLKMGYMPKTVNQGGDEEQPSE
ncbi:MAG: helicase-associated domain-containing protein [Candidatus Coatesbacteria bacterium]|nr:helicase-associated domain-containing protein [Candidatus Coatesbacteria bacterium]